MRVVRVTTLMTTFVRIDALLKPVWNLDTTKYTIRNEIYVRVRKESKNELNWSIAWMRNIVLLYYWDKKQACKQRKNCSGLWKMVLDNWLLPGGFQNSAWYCKDIEDKLSILIKKRTWPDWLNELIGMVITYFGVYSSMWEAKTHNSQNGTFPCQNCDCCDLNHPYLTKVVPLHRILVDTVIQLCL